MKELVWRVAWMKKGLTLILAVMMLFAVVSCGTRGGEETTKANDPDKPETTAPEKSTSTEDTVAPEESTPEEHEIPENPDTLPELIDRIYEIYPVKIPTMTTECDLADAEYLKYAIGLESVDKTSAVYTAGAMLSSQAYELALVRVKNAADAEAVAREILEGANPRKWICVTAESVKVAVSGDMILLVMSSEEETTGLVDAFQTVCGGKLDLILKK